MEAFPLDASSVGAGPVAWTARRKPHMTFCNVEFTWDQVR